MAFSTWDADNGNSLNNCAKNSEHAGWWYKSCTRAILMECITMVADGMYWKNRFYSEYTLINVAMKIKPKYRI